jgi:hypothetical protein
MADKANDLVDVLLDIFANNYIDPSSDWLNLPLKELIKQLENLKQKFVSVPDKDRRRKATIADGLFIHALLTLVHNKYALEKNECLESTASTVATVLEQAPETTNQPSHSPSLDSLSRREEQYLIHLADFLPSALELKKSMKDGVFKQKELPNMGREHIGKWQWLHVKWHAAGHILFWLDNDATTEKIKNTVLYNPKLFALLDLGALSSTGKCPNTAEGEEIRFRTLEDEIRKVNPKGAKKGRRRKNDVQSERFIFSPLVFNATSKKINMKALQIAIYVMVKMLKIQKMTCEEICNHPIIYKYKSLNPDLVCIIDSWIVLAFKNEEDEVAPIRIRQADSIYATVALHCEHLLTRIPYL